jgi:hypothetical protein
MYLTRALRAEMPRSRWHRLQPAKVGMLGLLLLASLTFAAPASASPAPASATANGAGVQTVWNFTGFFSDPAACNGSMIYKQLLQYYTRPAGGPCYYSPSAGGYYYHWACSMPAIQPC